MTSELFQHVAMMSRLQVDMSNIFMPAPINPAAPEDMESVLTPKQSGVTVLPFVATNTGD